MNKCARRERTAIRSESINEWQDRIITFKYRSKLTCGFFDPREHLLFRSSPQTVVPCVVWHSNNFLIRNKNSEKVSSIFVTLWRDIVFNKHYDKPTRMFSRFPLPDTLNFKVINEKVFNQLSMLYGSQL